MRSTLARFAACLLPLGVFSLAAAAEPSAHSIEYYVQPALRDATARVRVVSKDNRELSRMGKGFVDAYRLSEQTVWFKEPGRVRFQGKMGIITVKRITSSGRHLLDISFPIAQHRVEDISGKPGKADTISDVGIVTESWLHQLDSKWLRTETREGKSVEVFDVHYKQDPDFHLTLWLDPHNRTMVEMIGHHRNHDLPGFKKRLVFEEARLIEGVWFPGRVTMYSTANRPAAVMSYDQIHVNTGLSDKLFNF